MTWRAWFRASVRRLLRTERDHAASTARVVLGLVMLPHGLQKLPGWFGGPGFAAEMHFFTEILGIPWLLGLGAILVETIGAGALVLGFVGRLAAAGVAVVMTVAAWTVHRDHGFFMNWSGTQGGEGMEYHALAIGLALVIVIRGSGAFSVDRLVTARL